MGEILKPTRTNRDLTKSISPIGAGVKLIVGFIFKEEAHFNKAKPALLRYFGSVDFESQSIPFNYTDYYREEFGEPLKRKFISFRKLISPDKLCDIKALSNKIEDRLSLKGRRMVNIDPGYLDLSRLILATTKDFAHRIYLNRGIYAEVTLFYKDKTFHAWPWTYPDYKTVEYIETFNKIREIYRIQKPK